MDGIHAYLIACNVFECSHVFDVLFRQNSSHPNKMNPFRHIYAGFSANYFGISIFWCIGPFKVDLTFVLFTIQKKTYIQYPCKRVLYIALLQDLNIDF